jgi:hypothetical protein
MRAPKTMEPSHPGPCRRTRAGRPRLHPPEDRQARALRDALPRHMLPARPARSADLKTRRWQTGCSSDCCLYRALASPVRSGPPVVPHPPDTRTDATLPGRLLLPGLPHARPRGTDPETELDRMLSTPRHRLRTESTRLHTHTTGPVPAGLRTLADGSPKALHALGRARHAYSPSSPASPRCARRRQPTGSNELRSSWWTKTCHPVLVHPLSPARGWLERSRSGRNAPVAQLIGASRAELLRMLDRPMTPMDIAAPRAADGQPAHHRAPRGRGRALRTGGRTRVERLPFPESSVGVSHVGQGLLQKHSVATRHLALDSR